MLWYKAWIETRARFIAALFGITFIVGLVVYHFESVMEPSTLFSDLFISRTEQFLMGMWMLSVILFAMGGLAREKATSISDFTLALPVSRVRLLAIRIAVGVFETIFAALAPWIAILAITHHFEKPFPMSQAALYLLLLISGGLVYFGLAVLISTIIEGEYTAPAVAYGVTLLTVVLFNNTDITDRYLNIGKFASGGFLFDRRTYLLRPEIPWLGLTACWAVVALLLFLSFVATDRYEF